MQSKFNGQVIISQHLTFNQITIRIMVSHVGELKEQHTSFHCFI